MVRPRTAKALITLAPYLLIFSIWAYFGVMRPIPYWQEAGDYPWYSLSYALTFESDYAGHPAFNYGFGIHPGIPFGIVSWLAFRLATIGITSSAHRITFVIAHADHFWTWAKICALALNFSGIYFLQRLLNPRLFWIGIAAYFAIVPAAFGLSLLQMTNESFALPFVVGYYLLVWKYFQLSLPQSDHRILPERDQLAIAAGLAAAFGCSIKIYYLAPAVGFACGLLVATICGAIDRRTLVRTIAWWCAGFVGLGAILVFSILSWAILKGWVIWNWDMLTHVDRYASGAEGIVSASNVAAAFLDLSRSTWLRFPLLPLSGILVLISVFVAGIKSADWRRDTLPYLVSVSIGFSISLFGLLKHYAPQSQHYALPMCAALPCILAAIDTHALSRRAIAAAALLSIALLLMNIVSYSDQHQSRLETAAAILRDNASIDAMPIAPTQRRIWTYYSATKAGALPMIDQYQGSSYISDIINIGGSQDISPVRDPDAADWKYVIFPKSTFPTVQIIRAEYAHRFDLGTTNFKLRDSDSMKELSNFFVLTRATPPH